MTSDKGILIKNIYYMLAYAAQQPKFIGVDDIAGEDFDEVHDLLAWILFRGVSSQLKQGLHKEYISKSESMTSLRGKLNINGTIRHRLNREQVLSCEYDELSINNLFNQILKTTMMHLISLPNVKKDKKADIKKIMLFFVDVDEIEPKLIKWSTLRFDRNTRTYQLLLMVCQFVLCDMLMTTEDGKYRMKTLSEDYMCRLYEKFILEYYKKNHPTTHASAAQIDWNIDKEATTTQLLPTMQTDIMLTLGERILIIDAKYYAQSLAVHMNKKQIHTNNLYQIHTYVTNKDTKHDGSVDGMLLYAKTQEEIVLNDEMKLRDGNTIYFRTLDLNKPFEDIAKQLDLFVTLEN